MNIQRFRMTASELAMGRYMRAPDHPSEPVAAAEPPAADPPAAEPPAAEPPKDEFSDAFAEFTTPEPKAGEPVVVVDPPAAEPPAAEPPAAPPPAAQEPPAAEPPAAPPPPSGESTDDLIKRLASEIGKATPPPPPPVEPVPAAEQEQPLYSADEQTAIAKFQEEWPQEAQAIQLMNRKFGKEMIEYIFGQIAPEVKAVREMVQTLALRAHQSDLSETIGDYSDQEVDEIKEWVKTQPSYLQGGMNGVIQSGTADEVADLVNRYREATGKKPTEGSGSQQEPQRGDTELSGAVKQAADDLAPVGSKRSVVQDADDKSNFDAAWGNFAKQFADT